MAHNKLGTWFDLSFPLEDDEKKDGGHLVVKELCHDALPWLPNVFYSLFFQLETAMLSTYHPFDPSIHWLRASKLLVLSWILPCVQYERARPPGFRLTTRRYNSKVVLREMQEGTSYSIRLLFHPNWGNYNLTRRNHIAYVRSYLLELTNLRSWMEDLSQEHETHLTRDIITISHFVFYVLNKANEI